MSRSLSPSEAAKITSLVEDVRSDQLLKDQLRERDPFGLGGQFDLDVNAVAKGVSGPSFMSTKKRESGFGYVAKGKGDFAGDTLVVFRGTKTFLDLWTDLNFSSHKGPRGFDVHGGFNSTFLSIKPKLEQELQAALSGKNPTRIHFVGHSLGGALATLAADWCLQENIAQPHLYTFGCPRVGTERFVDSFTWDVHRRGGSINRVFHAADIVPMVPMFPFLHVPMPGIACGVHRNGWLGLPVSISAHVMNKYTDSVTGHSWQSLHSQGVALYEESVVKKMWREASTLGVGRFSAAGLCAINAGLASLMEQAGTELCATAIGQMTILDRMAWSLSRLASIGKECFEEVSRLLMLVAKFLGTTAVNFTKLTVETIRAVLYKLCSTLFNLARMALEGVARMAA